MRQSWEEARAQCQAALGELVDGRPEAFKAVWSHADDVTIMGAFGGCECGWENVARRLDWASAGIGGSERRVENLLTVVGQDLACTVDLEHMERTHDGRTYHRVLRCRVGVRARATDQGTRRAEPDIFDRHARRLLPLG